MASSRTNLMGSEEVKLFNLVKVEKNCGENPPRSFADYTVSVGDAPSGVEIDVKL